MESTSSKNIPQKLGEKEHVSLCGLQLFGTSSTVFSSEPNSAISAQECNPSRTSCWTETKLRRHSMKNVKQYKIFKLHEINEIDVSESNELPEGYVLDLSSSATSLPLQEHSFTDHIVSEPKSLGCGNNDKDGNSKEFPNTIKLYEELLKPHECVTCKKRFLYKIDLMRHKRIHKGEKPYQCKICKKKFNELYNLRRHELGHTGRKPYQCEMCSKCFTQKCNLNRHLLTHTRERLYECNTCAKTFSSKWNLEVHQRVHTGEKPYQCETCKKKFNDSCNLRKHELGHSEQKP